MVSRRQKTIGGVGEFIPPRSRFGFGLKVVRLLDKSGRRNVNFWNEARSIHRYCASVRFLAGILKIPLTPHYYLQEDDFYRLDRPWRQDREKTLSLRSLFYGAFIDRFELEKYRGYEPVPEELLQRIYEENLDADLLLVYPVAYGGEKNLTCYYADESFSSNDVKALISQIAGVILALFRNGTAHGDIKPENIMVSEIDGKKVFRLTDFGSTHFGDAPSNTGTNSFFDRELYRKMLRKTGSELAARVYTDFYALARTVLALALGHHPGCLVNEELVAERWPEIAGLWEKLQAPDLLSMDDFRKLAAEEPVAVNPEWEPFCSWCDEFESLVQASKTREYGRLHEQLPFSDNFDPLMRIRGIRTDK